MKIAGTRRTLWTILATVTLVPVLLLAAGDSASAQAICNGQTATIVGTGGADNLVGTDGDDVIVSFGGDDIIDAGPGNDTVCSGGGNDTVRAGAGNDWVNAGAGDDTVLGGLGDDELFGQNGNDDLAGDEATCEPYSSRFSLPCSNDVTTGGDDRLFGGGGSDDLFGDPGTDRLFGGVGSDRLFAGFNAEDDRLFGAGGDDELYGERGRANLFGGDDNDFFNVGGFQNSTFRLFGQDGDDTFQYGAENRSFSNVFIFGGDGNDDVSVDHPSGDYSGNFTFYGGLGDDSVDGHRLGRVFRAFGGAGNDNIAGPEILQIDNGSILIDGGLGDDILGSIADAPTEVEGRAGSDYLVGRGLRGGTGDDTLVLWNPYAGPELLEFGNEGNDVIVAALNSRAKVLAKDGDDVVWVSAGFEGIVWGGNDLDSCGGVADAGQLNCELTQATIPQFDDPATYTIGWFGFKSPDFDLPDAPGPGPALYVGGTETFSAQNATVDHGLEYGIRPSDLGFTAQIEATVNGVTTVDESVVTRTDVDFAFDDIFDTVTANSSGSYRVRLCNQGGCGLWGPELTFDYTAPPCATTGYLAAGAANPTTHAFVSISDLLLPTQSVSFVGDSAPVSAGDAIEIITVFEGTLLLDVNGTLGWADPADYSLTPGGSPLDLADLSQCSRVIYDS